MTISVRQLQRDMAEGSADGSVSLDALGKLHRWGGPSYQSGVPQRPQILSLRELGRRHSHVFSFLWLNTYLLPDIEIHVPWILDRKRPGAPVRLQRAIEIGSTIRSGTYDGAALCEAWTEGSKHTILSACGDPEPFSVSGWPGGTRTYGAGPLNVLTVDITSSGLLTVVPRRFALIGSDREKFDNEGEETRDADAWSHKGILLAVVDIGYNTKLEIYSTHLFNGGDFHDISDEDRIGVQKEQMDQIVRFIQRTHQPANFIVVAGDFNVNASTPYYKEVRQRFEDILDLEDVWTRYAQSRYGACLGRTEGPESCPPQPSGPGQSWLADDGIGGAVDDTHRIDYVFVQKPSDSHDISIDVSRPRRVLFPRPSSAAEYDKMQYLSDHLGIAFKLFFSSK